MVSVTHDSTHVAIHLSRDASDDMASRKQSKRFNSLVFRQHRHVESCIELDISNVYRDSFSNKPVFNIPMHETYVRTLHNNIRSK